jgi:hypothetical protein
LLNNFSQISLIAVWWIGPDQTNKGIFGTSNYSNLEIVADPGVAVRIRNNDYSAQFISSGFSNLEEWTLSYLDAENLSGVAYRNGQVATNTYINQIDIIDAGTPTSDGTYTRNSGGNTTFNGPDGNNIYFDGESWVLYDETEGIDTYYSPGANFDSGWFQLAGDPDAPTQTVYYGTSGIATSSAVEMPLASGVTYSLGRYAFPNYAGLNAEMYLAEFIIYNRRLTTPERQQVETYLNTKYAIYE